MRPGITQIAKLAFITVIAFYGSNPRVLGQNPNNSAPPTLPADNPGNLHANENAFPPHSQPHQAPFDIGIGMLVAAGVGYGMKKAYAKRKAESQSRPIDNR